MLRTRVFALGIVLGVALVLAIGAPVTGAWLYHTVNDYRCADCTQLTALGELPAAVLNGVDPMTQIEPGKAELEDNGVTYEVSHYCPLNKPSSCIQLYPHYVVSGWVVNLQKGAEHAFVIAGSGDQYYRLDRSILESLDK